MPRLPMLALQLAQQVRLGPLLLPTSPVHLGRPETRTHHEIHQVQIQ